ncbi:MAG: carboxypeptidase-like regulatory domain-containing protein [Bacteroidetes bacterium]|nr:carboxypeptidase-like regulatory domain-containing protein [Bacteroidota bacterium]
MPEQDKHSQYSASDFERYYAGQMTEKEMHALEKAAHEDPFLSDALEGYAYTTTASEDVAALKQQIAGKASKKTFFLFSTWAKAAAVVAFIAGVWYFTAVTTNKLSPVAKNELPKQTEPGGKTESPAITANGSTATLPRNEQQKLVLDSNKSNVTAPTYSFTIDSSADQMLTASAPASGMYKEQVSNENTRRPMYDSDSIPQIAKKLDEEKGKRDIDGITDITKDKELVTKANVFRGKVLDEKGQPIAFANVIDTKRKQGFVTNEEGKFVISTNDTNLLARVDAVGYSSLNKTLSVNGDDIIVLSPDSKALQEVVIAGNKLEKMRQKAAKPVQKPDSLLAPSSGWPDFEDYVASNNNLNNNRSNNVLNINKKDTVVLSFFTNKEGKPYKIKVVKSVSPEYDKEAIRLLNQGPLWNNSINKRATVSIAL